MAQQDRPTFGEEAYARAQETLAFLKKCYEVGNKPLWVKPGPRERALAKKARAKKDREMIKKQSSPKALLCGEVTQQMGSKYKIGEQYFTVTPDTWTIGILKVGAVVEVHGKTLPDTEIVAKKVVILKEKS